MEPIDYTKEDGTVIKVVPVEVAEGFKTQAEQTAAQLAEKDRLLAEKTDNFKKFNELSEEEKKRYNENEIIQMRRNDALENELNTLKTTLTEKEKKEQDSVRTNILKGIHGDNAEIETKIKDNYAKLAGMPETTPEEIQARAMAAANLSGITFDSRNPLYIPAAGAPPSPAGKGKEFVETQKGTEALNQVREALGQKVPEAAK